MPGGITPGEARNALKSDPNVVTPEDIWTALRNAGATPIQAAGIMGNWISESSLDPEVSARDSNGAMSYGLAQWNAASYPQANSLVTGHAKADLNSQVRFLAQTGGLAAARGSTAQQAAASYAANYERCKTCQPGGAQSTTRQAQAATVAGWAAAGSWPASAQGGTDNATLKAASQAQSSATCLWQLPSIDLGITSVGGSCVLSKSQGRAIESVGIMTGGTIVLGFGLVLMLVGTALASPRVRSVAGKVVPGGVAGAAVAAASSGGQDDQTAQENHTAAQYRRQSGARQRYQRDAESFDEVPF